MIRLTLTPLGPRAQGPGALRAAGARGILLTMTKPWTFSLTLTKQENGIREATARGARLGEGPRSGRTLGQALRDCFSSPWRALRLMFGFVVSLACFGLLLAPLPIISYDLFLFVYKAQDTSSIWGIFLKSFALTLPFFWPMMVIALWFHFWPVVRLTRAVFGPDPREHENTLPEVAYTLTPQGFHIRWHDGSEAFTAWSGVRFINRFPWQIVVWVDSAYYAIPERALPPGLSLGALARTLRAWKRGEESTDTPIEIRCALTQSEAERALSPPLTGWLLLMPAMFLYVNFFGAFLKEYVGISGPMMFFMVLGSMIVVISLVSYKFVKPLMPRDLWVVKHRYTLDGWGVRAEAPGLRLRATPWSAVRRVTPTGAGGIRILGDPARDEAYLLPHRVVPGTLADALAQIASWRAESGDTEGLARRGR
jgi:hypothetical protein